MELRRRPQDDRWEDEMDGISTRTAHEEDERDGKTMDDGWEDERDKMSIRAFCGDD